MEEGQLNESLPVEDTKASSIDGAVIFDSKPVSELGVTVNNLSEDKIVITSDTMIVSEEKSVGITSIEEAKQVISDIEVFGDGDLFQLICKASSKSQGWMKSTKAMQVHNSGCVIQVTTQLKNPDGSYSVAEALTYVPGAKIIIDGDGNKLIQA